MKKKTKKLLINWLKYAGLAVLVGLALYGLYALRAPGPATGPSRDANKSLAVSADRQLVKLYYYNRQKDQGHTFDPAFVLPVERTVPRGRTPLQDAINLLLKGELTWQEKAAGFETEFPHPGFKLISLSLKSGVLKLEFTDVPGFTSGGASRVGLLRESIIKTARQFPQVSDVWILPEYLFQP